MSLPKELLDQLLSGYLDDALTADERVRVEQLLRTNPEVADELEQLRDLRASLQVLSRVDADVRLDSGFADRVLGEAVARAREEGLGDDHPLVALAEQPIAPVTPAATDVSVWRVAAVMLGLAASIAIAVLAVRYPRHDTPGQSSPDLIASSDSSTETERPVLDAPGGELPGSGAPAPNTLASDSGTPAGEAGSQTGGSEGPEAPPSSRPVRQPSTREVAASDVPALTEGATSSGDSESEMQPGTIGSIAASDSSSGDVSPGSATPPMSPSLPSQFGAILVLDVRRTETGKQSEVVANAMAAVEITPAHRKEVSDQVAQFVADGDDQQETDASVFYLQLPAKKFDRLYQQLWADEEDVESVRMAVVFDAPLLNVVEAIRPDPTSVRHESAAYELFSQSGVVNQLAHELSELPFPPARRGASAVGQLGSGPDIQTQVLMLVR